MNRSTKQIISIITVIVFVSFFSYIHQASAQSPKNAVDIIWQSSGYTPPFYKGKALRTHQNEIRFVAIPHIFQGGSEVSAKNLVYTWEKDGLVYGSSSGLGKNAFTFDGKGLSQAITITVRIGLTAGNDAVRGDITVEPQAPLVLIYENNPLTGIQFQQALEGSEKLLNEEVTLSAFPYYFNIFSRNDLKLSYIWNMNGQRVETTEADLVLRKEGEVSGTSNIDITVSNTKEFLQSAKAAFSLTI
jgi:hypothetical protein